MPVMAGPFDDANEYLKAIPFDKKLRPEWLRSLHERGEKEIYTDPTALRHIGMPVGGFFAGTVYLSGDGRLWLWDIFNRDQEGISPRNVGKLPGIGVAPSVRGGLNYLRPAPIVQPFAQGFAVTVDGKTRSLDSSGFSSVSFNGRYPMGCVTYRDETAPIEVKLEAFSPFVPLNLDDSSLPATVMSYRVRNTSQQAIRCEVAGHLQNAVLLETSDMLDGIRRNKIVRSERLTALECSAASLKGEPSLRPDVVFEDFEKPRYDGWKVEGEAFGAGPVLLADVPDYQGDLAGKGQRVANSHASAPGDDVGAKDSEIRHADQQTVHDRATIHSSVGGRWRASRLRPASIC